MSLEVFADRRRAGRDGAVDLHHGATGLVQRQQTVHVASVDAADGRNPLGQVEAFARFQQGIADRCDKPPVATEMSEVGSYRFFGGE